MGGAFCKRCFSIAVPLRKGLGCTTACHNPFMFTVVGQFYRGGLRRTGGLKTGGIGGVLINPSGNIVSFCGGEVPANLMSVC